MAYDNEVVGMFIATPYAVVRALAKVKLINNEILWLLTAPEIPHRVSDIPASKSKSSSSSISRNNTNEWL